jgi:hypothetical protein
MSNDEQLVVTSAYLYPLENAKLHHTDKFEVLHRDSPTVILRRGQSFHLAVGFSSRSYDPNKDFVQLIFAYGKCSLSLTRLAIGVTLLQQ